ncbi:hypothetical protein PG993_014997 [Apiospora rasikravindrae]|uniref:Uncharacterized protein n=1 Tax=Apiospora rasikravindrae TaxID=990691 RepID=A0ABR1RPG4_9PEZI
MVIPPRAEPIPTTGKADTADDLVTARQSTGSGHNNEGRFTVLSVVKKGFIIYPGDTNQQNAGGHVVTPDQSCTPRSVPS